jgi:hypothetical protein
MPHGKAGKILERGCRPTGDSRIRVAAPLILLNLVVFGFGDSHPWLKTATYGRAATLALALHVSMSAGGISSLWDPGRVAAAAWRPSQVLHGGLEFLVVASFNLLTASPRRDLEEGAQGILAGGGRLRVVLGPFAPTCTSEAGSP